MSTGGWGNAKRDSFRKFYFEEAREREREREREKGRKKERTVRGGGGVRGRRRLLCGAPRVESCKPTKRLLLARLPVDGKS